MSSQSKIRDKLASRILLALEQGSPPWRSIYNRGVPVNPKTGKKFSGINPLVLDAIADQKKYRSKFWATYKQWKTLGQKVEKRPYNVAEGNWGIPIVNWHPYFKGKNSGNIVRLNKFHLLEQHVVFNAEQTFGKDTAKYLILNENKIEPDYDYVEGVIAATGANIEYSPAIEKPIYERLPQDRIMMPPRNRFISIEQYYAAVFHELTHYSEWRLGWTGTIDQGELIAEIATGYLESELCLPHDKDMTNHEKWLPEWVKGIKENPSYIFDAAAQAARAVDFILGFTRLQERESLQSDENVVKLPQPL